VLFFFCFYLLFLLVVFSKFIYVFLQPRNERKVGKKRASNKFFWCYMFIVGQQKNKRSCNSSLTRGWKTLFFFRSDPFRFWKIFISFRFSVSVPKKITFRFVTFLEKYRFVPFRFCKIFFCMYKSRPKHTKKNDDFIFCLFWYAKQQNPYNL
jgi:hypothetical protein